MELEGHGVSPGIAVGQALLVEREVVPVFRLLLSPDRVETEVQRLVRAVEASRQQLQAIKERLSREVGMPHAYIFDAHLLMLEDPLLLDRAVAVIREDHVNAEWALRTVSEQLHALFEEFTDAYLRERSTDLDDVLGRIQLNLRGANEAPSLSRLPGSFVIVARDLTPSEAAELDWERVLAIATDAGSSTYHTAILARSFGVPCVVGLEDATERVPPGALVIVDGSRGRVVVEPSGPTLERFRATQEREALEERQFQDTRALPAVTRDGVTVILRANVEFPDETGTARLYGAQGIGLFRSEYLLGRSREWPTEERQFEVYRRLLEQMHPEPVTVRTWDVGLEDIAPAGPTSPNPAMGERATRLLDRAPDVFRTQLRALLRASAFGPLRIMFPFIAGAEDLGRALSLLQESRDQVKAADQVIGEGVSVGVTVEVPSAALCADLLAGAVDFLSIGTNDLIQYLLAVDRSDPRVARYYQPLHPAVLRTLRAVVDAGARHRTEVAVCGEMAADPLQALVLLGLGVRQLSMNPAAIPRVKMAIRTVEIKTLGPLVAACLELPTAAEIECRLRAALGSIVAPCESATGGLIPS
ncbi:MAG TPA: phosphoenolpyruvate--protein phosphotransferase [Vicinamibacteria bacterium]|nr:phosphoenolpyruvate--protein phosphotransferase [Vicinamibacteria bacterium]